MTVRLIKKSWWVDFRFNHLRHRKRSPENSRAGALAYEAALRQKLARGERIDNVLEEANKDQTFEEFAWQWYEDYVVPNNKAGEQTNKKNALSTCLIPFFANMPISKITTQNIEQYKAQLQRSGKSAKTINNRLIILHTCLATAYEWLGLKEAVPKIKWLKCPPPQINYLSQDECGLLLSNASGVLHDMLLVALRTGVRRGEIIGLQWSSIDWHRQSITVRHSMCEYSKKLGTTKSNRERHVPMLSQVYTALFKKKRDTGYVFLDTDKTPFTGKQLDTQLKKLCKKAGIRKIGWHTLRHTFASQLAMNGVPLNTVQALLGHSSITTTMRYAHLAPSTLRSAIDMLDPKTAFSQDFGQPVGNLWIEAIKQNSKNL